MFVHADSKDSDQTGRMHMLICKFAVRNDHFLGFVMRRKTSKQTHCKLVIAHKIE